MLKKLTVMMFGAAVALVLCACSTTKVIPDQTSQAKLTETVFASAAYGDQDAFWTVVAPAVKDAAIKRAGSEETGRALVWKDFRKTCSTQQSADLKEALEVEDAKMAAIHSYIADNAYLLVYFDGKWYFDPTRVAPDQSSKASVAEVFIRATLIDPDANTLWLISAPISKASEKDPGAAIEEIARQLQRRKYKTDEFKSRMAKTDTRIELVDKTVKGLDKVGVFVRHKGKWYIDFDKLNRHVRAKKAAAAKAAAEKAAAEGKPAAK